MVSTLSQPATGARSDTGVVLVRALRKHYKNGAEALKEIDLEIEKGELFGLVGPDGAGKTTALKILAGVMQQTSGDAKIGGKSASDARKLIGYVPQNCALYPELSVEENLRYQAGLHGVEAKEFAAFRDKYLTAMGLKTFSDRAAGHLSGGMKQKLALCCALVSRPQLVLLDEPTTGLDPIARRELWQTLATLSGEGVTAIIATPFLDEAERCSRIALMFDGQIQKIGSPQELSAALNMERLDFVINSKERLNEVPQLLSEVAKNNILDLYPYGDRLEVLSRNPVLAERDIRHTFEGHGVELSQAHSRTPSLENVFVMSLRDLGQKEPSSVAFPRIREQSGAGLASSELALDAQRLYKNFGSFTAVDDVSVSIRFGEIFGLLGANGAGKTTTIKMLCGLMRSDSGTVSLLGESTDLRSADLRSKIGYMSQKFTLYDNLTVKENLEFYAAIYQIPVRERKRQVDWVVGVCQLKEILNSVVKKLPLGWKQRIAFGAAVMHDPSLIFLDEPTAGVDPLARRQLWNLVREFASNGAAILVTTHYLDEAEFCNKLAFMASGKVVINGTPQEIKSQSSGQLFEVVCDDTQSAFQTLSTELEHWRVAIFGRSIHVLLDSDDRAKLYSILQKCGFSSAKVRTIPFSLEDAFIDVVQRSQRS